MRRRRRRRKRRRRRRSTQTLAIPLGKFNLSLLLNHIMCSESHIKLCLEYRLSLFLCLIIAKIAIFNKIFNWILCVDMFCRGNGLWSLQGCSWTLRQKKGAINTHSHIEWIVTGISMLRANHMWWKHDTQVNIIILCPFPRTRLWRTLKFGRYKFWLLTPFKQGASIVQSAKSLKERSIRR